MGLGDEIMAMGRAEELYEQTGKPVAICDRSFTPRSHPVWENNPAVDQNSDQKIIDCPGARPYILRWEPGPICVWNTAHKARAGKITLRDDELECPDDVRHMLGEFAVVEPLVRHPGSPNKDWGFERWEKVIRDFPIPVIQLMPSWQGEDCVLQSAAPIVTASIREAAGLVRVASLVMTVDGGMHHMAASMGTSAVVVFGGFADPAITGYNFQMNFVDPDGGTPCGRYQPCEQCQQTMSRITPSDVRRGALWMFYQQTRSSPRDLLIYNQFDVKLQNRNLNIDEGQKPEGQKQESG